jgi:hypothetical protein
LKERDAFGRKDISMTGEKHIRKDLKKAVMTYRGTQSYSSVKGGEFLA